MYFDRNAYKGCTIIQYLDRDREAGNGNIPFGALPLLINESPEFAQACNAMIQQANSSYEKMSQVCF